MIGGSLFGKNGSSVLIELILPACHIQSDFQLIDHDVKDVISDTVDPNVALNDLIESVR
jgi:hypothetical protein